MLLRSLLLFTGFAVINISRAQCPAIDFEGLPDGTPISDMYQSCGVVFSSNGFPQPPMTMDFGALSWTSTLRSVDWYEPVRFDFVEPADGVTSRPASWFSFDNPIDSEVDFIEGTAYDAMGNVLATFTSASPGTVFIDAGGPMIAYVVLDDMNSTGYVIDNLSFEAFSTGISTEVRPAFELVNTLVSGSLAINCPEGAPAATVVAQDGRVVRQWILQSGTHQYATDDLAAGTYTVLCITSKGRHSARFVKQ